MRIIGDTVPFEHLHGLEQQVFNAAHNLYGCTVSGCKPLLHKPTPYARVEEEWNHIVSMNDGYGWKTLLLLKRITDWLKLRNSPYWMNGTAGNSLTLYLLGITQCNPLPPHRRMQDQRGIVWTLERADGFDLDGSVRVPGSRSDWDEWACEQVGIGDGHHLPYMLMKWDDLCICCSSACEGDMRKVFASLGIVEDQTWLEAKHKRKKSEYEPLTPAVNIVFSEDIPERDDAFFDAKVTSENWRQILDSSGLTHEAFLDRCFELSLRAERKKESGNTHYLDDMRELIGYLSEDSLFADMVSFGGLCVNDMWNSTTKTLVKELEYPVHSMIAFRDDVYYWLLSAKSMRYGIMGPFDACDAENISVLCSKPGQKDSELRHAVTEEYDGAFKELPCFGLEPWVLKQIREHRYFFPKAHAVERILFQLKLLLAEQMRNK